MATMLMRQSNLAQFSGNSGCSCSCYGCMCGSGRNRCNGPRKFRRVMRTRENRIWKKELHDHS